MSTLHRQTVPIADVNEDETHIDGQDFDMVVLAILTVADCSGYTLERLVRQTLHTEQPLGAAVYRTVRRLMDEGYASSYQSPGIGKQMFTSTKEGRAYWGVLCSLTLIALSVRTCPNQ